MPSFTFFATLALLAFGVLSPIFFVVRQFLHPTAHSRQRTAILSLVCFLGGILLYYYAASWRAESNYETIKSSYLSIKQASKANPASLTKEHDAILRQAVDSSETDVTQSKQLLRMVIAEAPVAFLIYYSVLLLLSWIAGLFRPHNDVAHGQADSIQAVEPENPSFLARACMILVLAIGVEGLGVHLYLSNGGKMHIKEAFWLVVNLGSVIAACILYYLFKGVPRGADRLFAKNTLGPTFFWCAIPTLSILARIVLLGVNK